MEFRISITHDRRQYRFLVRQLPSDPSFDYYQVIGRNGSITFRNNAPVLRRHSLKHRRPDWKITQGDIWNAQFKQKILEALEAALKQKG